MLAPPVALWLSSVPCVLAAIGCNRAATFTQPIPPFAAIHWLHAVPDTMQEDFRVVDIVSNAGLFDQDFRGSNMFYQGIEAGTRRIRIFNSSPDPVIAQQVLIDTSFTFTALSNYTLIHMGFARTGRTPAREVRVIPDAGADPGATNVGFRIVHAGAGLGNVDVNLIRHRADTAALPATPLVANVAYGAASAYIAVAADAVAADSLRVVVTAAGTTLPILANVALPAGQAGTTSVNPIPGARVAGSVMTAVVVPRSVVGSKAPAAFTTPSAVILVDRRPPDTVP